MADDAKELAVVRAANAYLVAERDEARAEVERLTEARSWDTEDLLAEVERLREAVRWLWTHAPDDQPPPEAVQQVAKTVLGDRW